MLASLSADIVLLIHFAFILFAVFGGLLVLFRRKAAWLHLPAVVWSSIVDLAGDKAPGLSLPPCHHDRVAENRRFDPCKSRLREP